MKNQISAIKLKISYNIYTDKSVFISATFERNFRAERNWHHLYQEDTSRLVHTINKKIREGQGIALIGLNTDIVYLPNYRIQKELL